MRGQGKKQPWNLVESLLCGREKKDESVTEAGQERWANLGDSALARLSETRGLWGWGGSTCRVNASGQSPIQASELREGSSHACGVHSI